MAEDSPQTVSKTRLASRVKLFVLSGEKLLTSQTSDAFATTFMAFMMHDGQGNEIPVVTHWSVYSSFIPMTVCMQQPSLTADDHCNRCLAKRDQQAAMLSLNYFFIFRIIKNSQKMAYIMNKLHVEWIFEHIAKTAKTTSFSIQVI